MVKISAYTVKQTVIGASPFLCHLIEVRHELRNSFSVNHGTLNYVDMIQIHLTDGIHTGRGEARLYKAYDETFERSSSLLQSIKENIHENITTNDICSLLPAGATRNAFDLALIDFQSQREKKSISQLLDLPVPSPVRCTDLTLSVNSPDAMQNELKDFMLKQNGSPTSLRVKMKMGGFSPELSLEGAIDLESSRIKAVSALLPENSECLVDANEGWNEDILKSLTPILNKYNIHVVEQPLPRGKDKHLRDIFQSMQKSFSIIADESFHDPKDLQSLLPYYDGFNIKLDKMGGLTTSLRIIDQIKAHDKKLMIGCMVGSSLSLAPAFWIAQHADWADLDGSLYLRNDYQDGVTFRDGIAYPASQNLWGYPRSP